MGRYFLEVMYKGTNYSGFQIQENGNTIQSEVEKALALLLRKKIALTGSSRTDAGVHALQNYFHFDSAELLTNTLVYKLNAVLPPDVSARSIHEVPPDAHCRFNAESRSYIYKIHRRKNPFLLQGSFFYPYRLNSGPMNEAAAYIIDQYSFFPFCKTNTQVKTFEAKLFKSQWQFNDEEIRYEVEGNRFLRGMVRLLTGTFLKLGREKMTVSQFKNLFTESEKCGHSVPACGLYLQNVKYPKNLFDSTAVVLLEN